MIRCVSSRLRRLPKVSSLVSRCTVVMSTSMRSDRRPRPGLLYSRCMRTWGVLAGAVAVVVVAGGCASTKQAQFQETIRKAAKTPVVDAEGDVPAVFRDLAQSGGLDPTPSTVVLTTTTARMPSGAGKHTSTARLGSAASATHGFISGIWANTSVLAM